MMDNLELQERIQELETRLHCAVSELADMDRKSRTAEASTLACTQWERELLDSLFSAKDGWDSVRIMERVRERANVERALQQPAKLEQLRVLMERRAAIVRDWHDLFTSLALPFSDGKSQHPIFAYCNGDTHELRIPA